MLAVPGEGEAKGEQRIRLRHSRAQGPQILAWGCSQVMLAGLGGSLVSAPIARSTQAPARLGLGWETKRFSLGRSQPMQGAGWAEEDASVSEDRGSGHTCPTFATEAKPEPQRQTTSPNQGRVGKHDTQYTHPFTNCLG